MLEGLNSAAARMAAQQQRLHPVANDPANANTTGCKHGRVGFRDLVYRQAAVDAGKSLGQGALECTDRPLDVAIQGDGFLRVRRADRAQVLTRDGNPRVDGRGRLATNTGALVLPAIIVPKGTDEAEIAIAGDGTIAANGRRLDRLAIVSVRSPRTSGLSAATSSSRHGLRPRGLRAARDPADAGRARGVQRRRGDVDGCVVLATVPKEFPLPCPP